MGICQLSEVAARSPHRQGCPWQHVTMAQQFSVPELVGERVRLEPLAMQHVAQLVDAATEDRSTYNFTHVPQSWNAMSDYVLELLSQRDEGLTIPFVQVDCATQHVVGVTRYLTIRFLPRAPAPFAVEIGGTWLAPSAQRTGINHNAKLLLLVFAFESWGVVRVDLKTDARNERSRDSIARLGASFEGVLRRWQPSQVAGEEGRFRDSAIYSILDTEWSAVRSPLEDRGH
jgi:RimJ/RimL family protein N-acetyltransferase